MLNNCTNPLTTLCGEGKTNNHTYTYSVSYGGGGGGGGGGGVVRVGKGGYIYPTPRLLDIGIVNTGSFITLEIIW